MSSARPKRSSSTSRRLSPPCRHSGSSTGRHRRDAFGIVGRLAAGRLHPLVVCNSQNPNLGGRTSRRLPMSKDAGSMTIIDTRTPEPKRFISGATGDWEVIIGMEVHAQVTSRGEAVLRRLDRVRRRAQRQCQPGRCGDARHAAGHQRGMRQAGDPHRARAEGADQPANRSSTGRTTSIRTCRRATRSRSTSSRSSARAP